MTLVKTHVDFILSPACIRNEDKFQQAKFKIKMDEPWPDSYFFSLITSDEITVLEGWGVSFLFPLISSNSR